MVPGTQQVVYREVDRYKRTYIQGSIRCGFAFIPILEYRSLAWINWADFFLPHRAQNRNQ